MRSSQKDEIDINLEQYVREQKLQYKSPKVLRDAHPIGPKRGLRSPFCRGSCERFIHG